MTLRRKTLLIVVVTVVSLVATLSLLARRSLLARAAALDEEDLRAHVAATLRALETERRYVEVVAEDYAFWDDTYAYMTGQDPSFTRRSLPAAGGTSLELHAVVLVDLAGRLVHGHGLDLESRRDTPLPAGIAEQLARPSLRAKGEGSGSSGLLALPGGLMLVAVRPILTSEGAGPPRGTLLIGRWLDHDVTLELSRNLPAPGAVTLFPLDSDSSPDLAWARERLSRGEPLPARPRGEAVIAGYALLPDVHGRPAALLRVETPRTVYTEGRRSLAYVVGSLLLAGLAFGAVALVLLERFVLSRLGRLAADVRGIAGAADPSARVALTGRDELSALAEAVNGMLAALEASRRGLQESEARLNDVVQHSTNLFYVHTPDQRLTYVSPQSRSFFDCEPEEALVRWTEFLTEHPANARGLELTRRAIDTGQRQPVYELELVGRKSRRIWVEVSETPVVREGKTVAIVGALRDVTELKRAEAERARLQEQLLQAQKMEAVGRLAGGVAHDFNNLLNVIVGYGELALRRLPQDDGVKRHVQEILRAAQRAAALTSQLLAFGRRQVLQPRVMDLNAVLKETEPMLLRLIGEDVELSTMCRPDLGRIKADPVQIQQVILNLAANARDAMPRGGRLALETRNAGDEVLLLVEDDGAGMDALTRSQIFEPFFTTKEKGKGTGLGLATVYGIVQQSGGRIEVESEPGRGARFTLRFPREHEALPHERPAAAPQRSAPGSGAILLVEDEPMVRELAAETLRSAGYDVLEAGGPSEALALAQRHPGEIRLLLSDVVMPEMPGPALAERLTALRPGLKVLYMSGYTEDALAGHGVLEGVHLLPKPFTPDALERKVKERLAQ